MDCKIRKSAWLTLFFGVMSVIFVFLVKNVDVAPVGAFGSVVGLSHINKFFYEFFGFNMFWYKLTDYPGILLNVLVAFIFFIVGVREWIKTKSIFKVDKNLIVLGGMYFFSLLIYVLFEKYVVNYRPIILPGEVCLEPSFPSSHTMWTVFVMGSAITKCKRFIKNAKTIKAVKIVLYSTIFIIITGRIISGVHWFTDILGGLIIGFTLLAFYSLLTDILNSRKSKIKKF